MKTFGITLDTTLDFLVGDIKSATSKCYEIKDGVRTLSNHSAREYNKKGQRTRTIYYNTTGEVRLLQDIQFDGHENSIGYINFKNGLKDSSGRYDLNSNGRLKSKSHNGETEEIYTYENNLVQILYPNTGAKDIYECDDNGFAIKQLSLRGEDSIFGSTFGPDRKLTIFENDKFGNVIDMRVYDAETKELLFMQKNQINSFGNEIESIGYNADGSIYSQVKYNYQYDDFQNWVVKQTLTAEGKIYREEIREITYHPNTSTLSEDNPTTQPTWSYKRLGSGELGLFSGALMKNLFPKPLKGQLLVDDSLGDGSCILYFDSLYFDDLTKVIRTHYNSGSFAKSNAEDEWNELMWSIESATPDPNFNPTTLKAHFLST